MSQRAKKNNDAFLQSLQTRGNCGKLIDLKTGPISKYDGEMFTDFEPLAAGRYLVEIPVGDERIQIMVRQKNIEIVPDYKEQGQMELDQLKRATQVAKAGGVNGTNRSNVKLAVSSLNSQLKTSLKKAVKANGGDHLAAVKSMFAAFDADNDGGIDRGEFMIGCQKFGVGISVSEIDLIWPFVDIDCSGKISFIEIMEFLKDRGSERSSDQKADIARKDLNATKVLRLTRIKEKTKFRSAMSTLEKDIKQLIRGHMKATGTSCDEVFELFDEDGGGTIDKVSRRHDRYGE
jgi:Ca2+-binding EF-hand superfamily protein